MENDIDWKTLDRMKLFVAPSAPTSDLFAEAFNHRDWDAQGFESYEKSSPPGLIARVYADTDGNLHGEVTNVAGVQEWARDFADAATAFTETEAALAKLAGSRPVEVTYETDPALSMNGAGI